MSSKCQAVWGVVKSIGPWGCCWRPAAGTKGTKAGCGPGFAAPWLWQWPWSMSSQGPVNVHQPAAAASVPDLIPVLSQEPPAKTPVLKTHGTIQEFIFSLYRTTPLPGTALTELSQKVSFCIQQKEREACHKFFASYAFLLRHSPGFEIQQLLIVDRGGSKEFVRDAWDCIIAACFIWMGLDFCLHYLEKD